MNEVKVVVREKGCDNILSIKTMPRPNAINFCAMWDFKHSDSDFYICIEELSFDKLKG